MYIIFFLFFSIFSYATPSYVELSQTQKWLNLLHYKKSLFGGYESQADGKDFFLHPEGKKNPTLELKEHVRLFSKPIQSEDHPACKFPLRFKWLNSQLENPWVADFSHCKRYLQFFSKLAAKRATIVFSSYYLSNPNSAFGHTFLRLSRFDDSNETEMLDYGINYSAEATSTNPFAYAYNGLMGGFKGKFMAIPYYYKVREYTNSEFRDLWSYDLNVSFPQVLEMVDHIWELAHTYFDYFYFKENCSYHLLSIIEVALPEKRLTDEYAVFAIPADTIRLLKREGLIGKGKRRESTYSKLVRLSGKLNSKDLAVSQQIAKDPVRTKDLIPLDNKRSADILDVSLEAFDYYNAEKILGDDLNTKEIKDNILYARAANPIITSDILNEKDSLGSPAESHSPTRAELSQGYENKQGSLTRLELRASHHDLLDPPKGSLKDAQLEIGKVSFRQKEFHHSFSKLQFEKLSLVNIINLPEQNFWTSPLAWEIDVGATQIDRLNCQDCPGGFLKAGVGNSLQLGEGKSFLLALLFSGEFLFHNEFQENYQMGVGPKFYLRYILNEKVLTALQASYLGTTYSGKTIFQNHEQYLSWETRFHFNKNNSLALRYSLREIGSIWFSTGELGIQHFY